MRRFDDINPVSSTVYYLFVTVITMFSMNPIILAISLLFAVLTYSLWGKADKKAHIFSLILFLIMAVLNPLVVHNGATPLFYLNDRPFTLEAVLYGITAAGMITAALYWLRSFSRMMTVDKLLYLFSRFSPKLSLILSMAIRYVALFRQRYRKITDTQKALGLYKDNNLIDAIYGRMRVFSILITWAIENGIVTASSMDARGYGAHRRTSYAHYKMNGKDVLFILLSAALFALTLTGVYNAGVTYYPRLYMEPDRPQSIMGYLSFFLLCMLPTIFNTKEAMKWRCLISEN